MPGAFWGLLVFAISVSKQKRAQIGWVESENVPVDKPGLLRKGYVLGNIGFDPLGLKPTKPAALLKMQTKELQNSRVAMLAAAGFLAQELVNSKGIVKNLLA